MIQDAAPERFSYALKMGTVAQLIGVVRLRRRPPEIRQRVVIPIAILMRCLVFPRGGVAAESCQNESANETHITLPVAVQMHEVVAAQRAIVAENTFSQRTHAPSI